MSCRKRLEGNQKYFNVSFPLVCGRLGRWTAEGAGFPSFCSPPARPPSLTPSQMVQIGPEVKRSLKQMKH